MLSEIIDGVHERFNAFREVFPHIIFVEPYFADPNHFGPTEMFDWLERNLGSAAGEAGARWHPAPKGWPASVGFKREEDAVAFTLWLQ